MKNTLLCALGILITQPAQAKLELPAIFTDHMVLQRDMKVPVWGWADANAKVTVQFGNKKVSTRAGKDGTWKVELPALSVNKASKELKVTTSTGDKVAVGDVLVGEVWLASGQSNMEWTITKAQKSDQELAAKQASETFRIFHVPRSLKYIRQKDVNAKWALSSDDSAKNFSAVAWFFGKNLQDELDVPVGVISSAWGGSKIEPWINEQGYQSVKQLSELYSSRQQAIAGTPEYTMAQGNYLKAIEQWKAEAKLALESKEAVRGIPQQPDLMGLSNRTTGLYQGMIHGVTPYALKGFIWYQGESNNGEGMLYATKKRALINGWREVFDRPKAPFYFVQLAPFNYGGRGNLPELSFAQQQCLKIPNTGMAVINDIGNTRNIHPGNKSEVGRRLALWALANDYGKTELEYSGPLFQDYKATAGKITIKFEHSKGLKSRDGKELSHFEVADESGEWSPAKAKIKGNNIELTSDAVKKPTQARFAWNQTAEPNLCNGAGLPAGCFHTHWPIDRDLGVNLSKNKSYQSSDKNTSGWDGGLTDGVWGEVAETCYATGASKSFPKHVTIDLASVENIKAVKIGVPKFGSTKDVEVQVSSDGETFTKVSSHSFGLAKTEQKLMKFPQTKARYVRIVSAANHKKKAGYDQNHVFFTEVEVYGN